MVEARYQLALLLAGMGSDLIFEIEDFLAFPRNYIEFPEKPRRKKIQIDSFFECECLSD